MACLLPDTASILAVAQPVSHLQYAAAVPSSYWLGYFIARILIVLVLGGGLWRWRVRGFFYVCLFGGLFVFYMVSGRFGSPLKTGGSTAGPRPVTASMQNPAAALRASSAAADPVQNIVKAYMLARASNPASIQFLEWSPVTNRGDMSFINVRYSAMERSGARITTAVRFTVQSGAVVNAHVL